MLRSGLGIALWIFSLATASAQSDSLQSLSRSSADTIAVADTLRARHMTGKEKRSFYPVPRKALMFSLVTPGLGGGQIYNRDYWKLPIVYLGYGTSFYFIDINLKRYGDFAEAYKKFYFLDKANDGDNYGKLRPDVTEVEVYIRSQKRTRSLTIDQVRRIKDTYRRWRDWSVFAATAVYALAAIEANVAAHLKTFDMSDDLSLRVEPSFVQPRMSVPAPGVRVVLTLK